MPQHASPNPGSQAPLLDAGWLFLLAGLAILGATVLIPAGEDLREARWLRDRALAREAHRKERLERYEGYLDALESRDDTLVESLLASQLNLIPADRGLIAEPMEARVRSASVFPALEPRPLELKEFEPTRSRLGRWAIDNSSRLWMIAAGSLCVLLGLLPGGRGLGVPRG